MSCQKNGFTFIEILAALAISSLISIALWDSVLSFERLHQRQIEILALASKKRALLMVLREKIQNAGNFSCEERSVLAGESVHVYTDSAALADLGIAIKPHTDLLQLKTCVSIETPVLSYL